MFIISELVDVWISGGRDCDSGESFGNITVLFEEGCPQAAW